MSKKAKIILIATISVLLTFIGGVYVLTPKSMEVKVVTLEKLENVIKEKGDVRAKNQHLLYSTVSQQVEEIYIKEGDRVKQGKELFKLKTEDLELQLDNLKKQLGSSYEQLSRTCDQLRKDIENLETSHQANLSSTQDAMEQAGLTLKELDWQLNRAKENYEEGKSLYEQGALSKDQLDLLEEAYIQVNNQHENTLISLEQLKEQEASQIKQYMNNHDSLKDQLAHYESVIKKESKEVNVLAIEGEIQRVTKAIEDSHYKAPVEGVISEFNLEKGMMITPQVQIGKILENNQIYIECFVYWKDALHLKEGSKANIEVEDKELKTSYVGTINYVSPTAYKQVSSLGLEEERVKIKIHLDEEVPLLKPGYKVDVEMVVESVENAITVPKNAIFKEDGGDALYIIQHNKVTLCPIETGMETDDQVVVTKGLEEGDQVIIDLNNTSLKIGQNVKGKSH